MDYDQYYYDSVISSGLRKLGAPLYKKLREGVDPSGQKLTLYTSSKDSDLYEHYFAGDLQYGANAGLNYGDGVYTLLLPPDQAGVGYKADTRAVLYGEHLYEFEMDASRVMFLLWEEYVKTSRCKRLGSTPESFIADQFSDVSGKTPRAEILTAVSAPPNKRGSNAESALAFYRYCADTYYQNADGTLNTPFSGFVYRGQNDGLTCVVWTPYAMVPKRVQNSSGRWEPIEGREEYEEAAAIIGRESYYGDADRHFANEDRTFDGEKNELKERAYRYLMQYGRDSKAFLGGFTNVRIRGDGRIDATYKSNLPQLDGGHYFRATNDQAIEKLHELGFYLGTLECGIKFGSENNPDAPTMANAPRHQLPEAVTGGLILVNQNVGPLDCPVELGERKLKLVKCRVKYDEGFRAFDEVVLDPKKPSVASEKDKASLLDEGYEWAKSLECSDRLQETSLRENRAKFDPIDLKSEESIVETLYSIMDFTVMENNNFIGVDNKTDAKFLVYQEGKRYIVKVLVQDQNSTQIYFNEEPITVWYHKLKDKKSPRFPLGNGFEIKFHGSSKLMNVGTSSEKGDDFEEELTKAMMAHSLLDYTSDNNQHEEELKKIAPSEYPEAYTIAIFEKLKNKFSENAITKQYADSLIDYKHCRVYHVADNANRSQAENVKKWAKMNTGTPFDSVFHFSKADIIISIPYKTRMTDYVYIPISCKSLKSAGGDIFTLSKLNQGSNDKNKTFDELCKFLGELFKGPNIPLNVVSKAFQDFFAIGILKYLEKKKGTKVSTIPQNMLQTIGEDNSIDGKITNENLPKLLEFMEKIFGPRTDLGIYAFGNVGKDGKVDLRSIDFTLSQGWVAPKIGGILRLTVPNETSYTGTLLTIGLENGKFAKIKIMRSYQGAAPNAISASYDANTAVMTPDTVLPSTLQPSPDTKGNILKTNEAKLRNLFDSVIREAKEYVDDPRNDLSPAIHAIHEPIKTSNLERGFYRGWKGEEAEDMSDDEVDLELSLYD